MANVAVVQPSQLTCFEAISDFPSGYRATKSRVSLEGESVDTICAI